MAWLTKKTSFQQSTKSRLRQLYAAEPFYKRAAHLPFARWMQDIMVILLVPTLGVRSLTRFSIRRPRACGEVNRRDMRRRLKKPGLLASVRRCQTRGEILTLFPVRSESF